MADHYSIASRVLDPVEIIFEPKGHIHVTKTISRSQVPIGLPEYSTFQNSTVATGKLGTAPGELNGPYGVAIDEATHQIFIANHRNTRIDIFSETGEYICLLGEGQLTFPWGIAIHGDSVYVSCHDHTVSKFSLTDMTLVKKIGGEGSNNGQFYYPNQLTTDHIGRVFIADTQNHRVCIHETSLNHIRNITVYPTSEPYDVKIFRDRLYVLCPDDSPCIHVLTLEGVKLHSFITCEEGMNVSFPLFFCLDPLNNFIISDTDIHSIRIFSPEGNFLHKIGREGHREGMFYELHGIAVTPNGRLVCVSENKNYGLQIFY